jgi:signal transduction histidine kinase
MSLRPPVDPWAAAAQGGRRGTQMRMSHDFQADIDAVARIGAVPTILDVVCRATGMRFAAVARVTEDRWIVCDVKDDLGFGLAPGGELKVETTLCHEIRQSRTPVIINHVAEDEAYCWHQTPAKYGFQSYISMPIIRADGRFFGTLCAIDPKPARLNNPETIGMFKLFTQLIAFHLDALETTDASEAKLVEERKNSELREQFIAVLGHDLRNPLASIDAGAKMLRRTPLDARASDIVDHIQKTVVRMSGLIDNVLDFARGRLGGGLTLNSAVSGQLETILDQVVAELRASWPERLIATDFFLMRPVHCDQNRIAQLFSNLLANALKYGAPEAPIRVEARTVEERFELSVANNGEPIPADALERLFEPFSRGAATSDQQGLGLGLYIASEIARAHGGALSVVSGSDETRFTLRMPLR